MKPHYPGKTIAGRRRIIEKSDGPGPAMYNPKLNNGIAFTMQGRYATDVGMKENEYKPGPNMYNVNIDSVKPHNPGKSFGMKLRQNHFDCLPGPGEYTLYDSSRKGKGLTMAGRAKTANRIRSPGPAAYNIRTTTFDKPGITMAGKRKVRSYDCGPGPGHYNPQLSKGTGYTMQGKNKVDFYAKENI